MKALITGASSGIGREMARILAQMNVELFLAARRAEPMEELKKELKVHVTVISCDLSVPENCTSLYERLKNENIDIVINNAGFGVFGKFCETELDAELSLIDTNIKALHILTKLFLKDFKRRNSGYILNVASTAAFLPGPKFAAYYASKAYVYSLTRAIAYELKKENSDVYVGVLCPGPVTTEFNSRAGVSFALPSVTPEKVAHYALKRMFAGKEAIIPGTLNVLVRVVSKLVPEKLILPFVYLQQTKKEGKS